MNEPSFESEHEPDEERTPKDRSLLYLGIVLGTIVAAMAYLTFFVDDPGTLFKKKQAVHLEKTVSSQLDNSLSRDDSEIRNSLVKFIQAFYYDQQRGYFDPPSYFAPRTETYYNYHNLTYQRLREVHQMRISERANLRQNWIVSSLDFEHADNKRLRATYLVKTDYLNTLKNAFESGDIKYEMIIDESGKIVSLREVEIRNFSSIAAPEPVKDSLSLDENADQLPSDAPPIPEAAKVQHAETGGRYEGRVYELGMVDPAPEFPGGQKALRKFISANLQYPAKAKAARIRGRVYVSFVIEKNGEVNALQVIRGIGGGCDEEALRLLRATTPWVPGKIDGKPVRTAVTLPVSFR